MLNITMLLADEFGQRLSTGFLRSFGSGVQRAAAVSDEAARLVMERLATSDALYHNAEHTALVTLVAQDILRGLRLNRDVTEDDWLHFIVAALTHDVGYLRGVCAGDSAEKQVIDAAGNTISIPRGASDAYLAPYHVFRSKTAVLHRFAHHPLIDGERVRANGANSLPGAGRQRSRGDKYGSWVAASRRSYRTTRRPIISAQDQCTLL